MKKIPKILAAALALAIPLAALPAVTAETVTIAGGTDNVIFEDSNMRDFDFYTEFDQPMYILQNRLYAPLLTESKAIYKHGTYSDVDVSVDVAALVPGGNIDGGIYVQASGVNNAANGITAWNVNVEHDVNSSVFALKLHRFENNRWLGAKKEVYNIKYTSDTVHLRVVVKTGVLYAYLDGDAPVFTYNVGKSAGKVGLRSFYAPNYFENFSVTSPMITVEPELLQSKLAELDGFDYSPFTDESAQTLRAAVAEAKAALAAEESQADIDKAYADIVIAKSELTLKKTRADLDALTEKAQKMMSDANYTKSSVSSLRVVIEKCNAATEEKISYWYKILQHRMDSAVKYMDDVSQGDNNE